MIFFTHKSDGEQPQDPKSKKHNDSVLDQSYTIIYTEDL